ncbi:MAG: PIN domain nuclease [Protaetiibacter sp.]
MIVPDSSAWIDYLRERDTPARPALRAALRQDLAVLCEPVWAELMRGVRDGRDRTRIERTLAGLDIIPTAHEDWENAVTIARASRRRGVTIRSFTDCLIAGIVVRTGATLLHNDVDFERIADAFPLLAQTRG